MGKCVGLSGLNGALWGYPDQEGALLLVEVQDRVDVSGVLLDHIPDGTECLLLLW